jgi:hypothetical protein
LHLGRFAPYRLGVGRLRLVAASGLLVAVAAGGWLLVRPAREPGAPEAVPAAHRLPAVRREAGRWDRWTITEQFAAQHVIVVQIETPHLDESAAIARAVTGPLQDRYSEVMIYFHRPGRPDTLPPRRVQWSRATGFVETDFEQR